MKKLKEADLILGRDGSVYHLRLRPENIAEWILVVGDPQRVGKISRHFDKIEYRQQNREFVTHTGTFRDRRLTAMSTGIGPDNIDIVMNELDALVNIDLKTRQLKENKKKLHIIRLGTSGSIQPEVETDSFTLATHGLGLDGSLAYYRQREKVLDRELTDAFIQQTSWPGFLPTPSVIAGSGRLIKLLEKGVNKGITATAAGFYAPQGRKLRLDLAFPEMMERVGRFDHKGHKVVNFEMETATLYGLGRMLGHEVASICVILANRVNGTYSRKYKKAVEQLIEHALYQITA